MWWQHQGVRFRLISWHCPNKNGRSTAPEENQYQPTEKIWKQKSSNHALSICFIYLNGGLDYILHFSLWLWANLSSKSKLLSATRRLILMYHNIFCWTVRAHKPVNIYSKFIKIWSHERITDRVYRILYNLLCLIYIYCSFIENNVIHINHHGALFCWTVNWSLMVVLEIEVFVAIGNTVVLRVVEVRTWLQHSSNYWTWSQPRARCGPCIL